MRRFLLALIVGVLAVTASGLTSLVVDEPCTTFERAGSDDGVCPPMCVTCGCCAQAAEPAAIAMSATPDSPIAEIRDVLPILPRTTSLDILHVPKLRAA